MSIDRNEFNIKVEPGLKTNKKFDKFFYRFKIEGKTHYITFDYSNKNWDKRTRITKAKTDAYEYKEKKKGITNQIDENIKLDDFIKQCFETAEKSTSYSGDKWLGEKISYYTKFIKPTLGAKKVIDVRQLHIKNIISKVKKQGLSARTQKITLEVLNPIFKSAIANRIIIYNPCDGITIKRPKTKKKVQNASILLKKIYTAIMITFKDDIYYQALFLFALQGRRKSEIITMKWEYIDFDNNFYTIPETKNGEEQTFVLPDSISILLLAMQHNKNSGYVFESPTKPDTHIQNLQTQTKKLKKALNDPNFGIHYLRNVVVSAMAEQGINATFLSGALGHSDLNTIKKYLSIPYKEGSNAANKIINEIVM